MTAAIGGALGLGGERRRDQRCIPANYLNTVLFVWGPGRIVPVRVTALTINEKLYDGLLNPTHAEVQITLQSADRQRPRTRHRHPRGGRPGRQRLHARACAKRWPSPT